MLKIGHEVVRSGKRLGDSPIIIPVPEELETQPGIPTNQRDADWYAREYPLEIVNITERVASDWAMRTKDTDPRMADMRKEHDGLTKPMLLAQRTSAEIEPTAEPTGEDVSELIKAKALELGLLEVGITAFDYRYVFKYKKDWVKFPHAICLATEQDYERTQTLPSVEAEVAHSGTYRLSSGGAMELADYIRSLGYHAQVHNPSENSAPWIPMFVNAGLGQLGACGYLLTPHVGSRCRLIMMTTDAKVTYDKPVDYGMHAFCQVCQICVNRCPGRALMRDKIWWRGIQKNKVYFARCRPVMARYMNCGICMKVCPIQKYGMKNVLEHYATTGQVLGKGTHELEGFTLEDQGYFGPGELPVFEKEFFSAMPRGTREEWAFTKLQQKARADGGNISDELLQEFKEELGQAIKKGPGATNIQEVEELDYV
jgi:NAD-dependent dihydropyrimidine dehydrogenase PreA subunit